MKKIKKPFKRVPSYWWDFEHGPNGVESIIVESDDDRHPIIKTFYIKFGCDATYEISIAEKLINDLRSGRKSPKNIL